MGRGSLIVLGSGFFYLLFHYLMGGLMTHHLLLVGALFFLYRVHEKSRLFFLVSIPLFLKDILYDSLRYVPFEWIKPIHVSEPYQWDTLFFGVVCGGTLKPLNECLLAYIDPFLDLLCGAVYHLIGPYVYLLLFLVWQLRSWDVAGRYATAFLVMNLFAFATYILYPAAAPWYVAEHGFAQPLSPVLGSEAGLVGFDRLIGNDVSARLYSSNPVVFGAIPSMHAGFTFLGWLYSFRVNRPLRWVTGIYALLNFFSALYLQHHYLIDLVLGILYAAATFAIVDVLLARRVEQFFSWLSRVLSPARPSLVPEEVLVSEPR